MTDAYDPGREAVRMSFARDTSHGDRLHRAAVLTARHALTDAHAEMPFIIPHQTSEVWMKRVPHEITAARDLPSRDDVRPAFKTLTPSAKRLASPRVPSRTRIG